MPRLIDADALKDKSYETGKWMPVRVVNVEDIDAAPTIDAEPVRHGRWVLEFYSYSTPKCSYCGWKMPYSEDSDLDARNYCPNCGAKMDLEVQDEQPSNQ